MNILLTGGAGYIGSHTATVLAQAGHRVVLFDNFSNSQPVVAEHLHTLTGQAMPLVEGDIRDSAVLTQVLLAHAIDAVVHFAGLKAVGESVAQPLRYFDNNVGGTIGLLGAMRAAQVHTLVFSSSATVYSAPQYLPYDELHPTGASNPYGRTKLHIEEMLADLALAEPLWRIASLRYFNPVGAHPSGLIGENPKGIPNNLMPYIARVAAGELAQLSVFGGDYPTPDGTGVRDYIHVMDLAEGHLAALNYLQGLQGLQAGDRAHGSGAAPGAPAANAVHTFNLGTGRGSSVLEMVRAFQAASGQPVAHRIVPRRPGDQASSYADASKAERLLHWKARRSLADMCASTWAFQRAASAS